MNAYCASFFQAIIAGTASVANGVTAALAAVDVAKDAATAAVDHVPSRVVRALTTIMKTFRDCDLLFARLLHRNGRRRLVLLCVAHY